MISRGTGFSRTTRQPLSAVDDTAVNEQDRCSRKVLERRTKGGHVQHLGPTRFSADHLLDPPVESPAKGAPGTNDLDLRVESLLQAVATMVSTARLIRTGRPAVLPLPHKSFECRHCSDAPVPAPPSERDQIQRRSQGFVHPQPDEHDRGDPAAPIARAAAPGRAFSRASPRQSPRAPQTRPPAVRCPRRTPTVGAAGSRDRQQAAPGCRRTRPRTRGRRQRQT